MGFISILILILTFFFALYFLLSAPGEFFVALLTIVASVGIKNIRKRKIHDILNIKYIPDGQSLSEYKMAGDIDQYILSRAKELNIDYASLCRELGLNPYSDVPLSDTDMVKLFRLVDILGCDIVFRKVADVDLEENKYDTSVFRSILSGLDKTK